MSTVGVRELKNRLTHYLRRARQGEEVIVTERGKPVAILQALDKTDRPRSLEARLAQLAARGLVILPTGKGLQRIKRIRIAGPPVSQAILEDRR